MYFEILSKTDRIAPARPRAIVTLAIGANYLARWQRIARDRFVAYADRHGMDAILIGTHLDTSWRALKRSPAWQKCLILSQAWSAGYERMAWIDADCVPRADAPDLFEGQPVEAIGASFVYGQVSHADLEIQIEREFGFRVPMGQALAAHRAVQAQVYAADGLADPPADMIQTGVLTLSPVHHRPLFEAAYARDSQNRWYEQPALSYFALKAGIVNALNPRFNWLFDPALLLEAPHMDSETAARALETGDAFLLGLLRAHWNRCHFLHVGEIVWRALGDASGEAAAALDRSFTLYPAKVRA